jgi:hypothetical protein
MPIWLLLLPSLLFGVYEVKHSCRRSGFLRFSPKLFVFLLSISFANRQFARRRTLPWPPGRAAGGCHPNYLSSVCLSSTSRQQQEVIHNYKSSSDILLSN